MKKIIQIVLFLVLIFLIYFFYNIHLKDKKEIKTDQQTTNTIDTDEVENNLITNLEYDININENNNYNLTSEYSEIVYLDGFEVVQMQKVKAVFTDKKSEPIIIKSDTAIYNNKSYNTTFEGNIKVIHINNIIYGNTLILDFEKNNIKISGNVKYDGPNGVLFTDNIMIDLITKKIDIFMDKSDEKVVINSKN